MAKDINTQLTRIELSRFQTYAYGPYVPTCMDAHFDPYREGLISPGLSCAAMENIERVSVPLTPDRNH